MGTPRYGYDDEEYPYSLHMDQLPGSSTSLTATTTNTTPESLHHPYKRGPKEFEGQMDTMIFQGQDNEGLRQPTTQFANSPTCNGFTANYEFSQGQSAPISRLEQTERDLQYHDGMSPHTLSQLSSVGTTIDDQNSFGNEHIQESLPYGEPGTFPYYHEGGSITINGDNNTVGSNSDEFQCGPPFELHYFNNSGIMPFPSRADTNFLSGNLCPNYTTTTGISGPFSAPVSLSDFLHPMPASIQTEILQHSHVGSHKTLPIDTNETTSSHRASFSQSDAESRTTSNSNQGVEIFCEHCDVSFTGKRKNAKANLKRHLGEKHTEQSHVNCHLCNKKFTRKNNMESHIRNQHRRDQPENHPPSNNRQRQQRLNEQRQRLQEKGGISKKQVSLKRGSH